MKKDSKANFIVGKTLIGGLSFIFLVTTLLIGYSLIKSSSTSTKDSILITTPLKEDYGIVADFSEYIQWDGQNNLYYFDRTKGLLYKWKDGVTKEILDIGTVKFEEDLGFDVYQISVFPDGKKIAVSGQLGIDYPNGSKMFVYNFDTKKKFDLPITDSFLVGNISKSIWGNNINKEEESDKLLWKYNFDGKLDYISLSRSQEVLPFNFVVDDSEKLVAVEEGDGVIIWNISNGKQISKIKNASTPVWINGKSLGLAYLDTNNKSLNIALQSNNFKPVVLMPDIDGPIVGIPGEEEIVYTVFNPTRGGSEFWAINVKTEKARQVSKAIIESTRAKNIKVSPDGNLLAFNVDIFINMPTGGGGKLYVVNIR